MTRSQRITRGITIVVVAAVVIAAVVLVSNLDRIVKTGVETYGPKITGVTVTVDAVHIGLLNASAHIKGLVVGNPKGYQSPQAISIGAIGAAIDPTTVFSQKTRIRFVRIESPEITFEGGLDGNNLSAILDNVNGSERSGGPTVTNAVGNPRPPKKYEVDDLVISGAKVNGAIILFGGKQVSIPNLSLPEIHLTNLGQGAGGITITDLTRQILQAITTSTVTAVTSRANNLGGAAENLGKQGVNSVKKAFGNLLGK